MKPIIVINFKTYKEATGIKALNLAKKIERVSINKKANIIIAVQSTDIYMITKNTTLKVFAEHIDPITPGRNTGFITSESIINSGGQGTLLNHSEHRIRIDLLEKSINIAKENGLTTIVCANDPLMVLSIATFKPDYIAYEPPDLIGGNISVSTRPKQISLAVRTLQRYGYHIPLLVGAGVKNGKDLKVALEHGAKGVLIASGIIKAKDPERALLNLLNYE